MFGGPVPPTPDLADPATAMNRPWSSIVYGPAYLDRVLCIEGPLLDRGRGRALDRSFEGRLAAVCQQDRLELHDNAGGLIRIDVPHNWPGPRGMIWLSGRLIEEPVAPWSRRLQAAAWHDDLGGMGAGYAKALGSPLISALGPEGDPYSIAVAAMLKGQEIDHHPVRVTTHPADWTLLITSGPFGDKLPVGFRGCHTALMPKSLSQFRPTSVADGRPSIVVAAGLGNSLIRAVFESYPLERCREAWTIRFFAPSMRNVLDRRTPIASFAELVDAFSCNREEWLTLTDDDRNALDSHAWLIIVTDGPRGASVTLRNPDNNNEKRSVVVPAFPREAPPVDTNHAGEAFAASLLTSWVGRLVGHGSDWPPECWLERAAQRASAAAALTINLPWFGFPTDSQVDRALANGLVAAASG